MYTDGNRKQEWKSRITPGLRLAILLLRRGGGCRLSGGEVDHAMLHEIPCMIGPRPSSHAPGGIG